MRNAFIILAILNCLAGHGQKISAGFDLAHPSESWILPEELHEISGLTPIDSATFGCVQDEAGVLFIYNTLQNRISERFTFATPGDYEGVTRVGNNMYVLRSDGALAEILNFRSSSREINYLETGIPIRDNEGLFYDAPGNRLLIGCKSKPGDPAIRDMRYIYAFDVKGKSSAVAYEFDVQELLRYALANGTALPMRKRKKGKTFIQVPVLRLSISEIAIHPINHLLYVLSAADRLLFVFDAGGKIKTIESLDPSLFNKPEGLAFLKNGDMIVTNEGGTGRPSLHKFVYRNR
jgi:hypothetical protein